MAERSKALVLKTSVARATVGSNPTLSATHRAISSAGRAPRLHRGSRRFDPVIAHHVRSHRLAVRMPPFHGGDRGSIPLGTTSIFRGVAQPGSASGLGPEGRRFESCHPDQHSDIAQLVEQAAVNRWVPGSSPGVGAK